MTTNTSPVYPPSRRDPRQVANTLVGTVNYNDAGIATGLAFANSLPMGARIIAVLVEIITAFNAATTNVLTVGTNSTSYNNLVAAADVDETVAATTSVGRGLGGSIARAAEVVPFLKYTQTGTAATAGKAEVTIVYEGGWAS